MKALSQKWDEQIPPIECIVVNQATGLPGDGIGQFLSTADFKKLPSRQKRELIEQALQTIFIYPKWDKVLSELGLTSVVLDFTPLLKRTVAFRAGAGGESEAHRRLKNHVANHPDLLDLPSSVCPGKTEYPLPSGDQLDVSFHHKDTWIAAEVKSAISSVEDITRGIFQCVKYRAVMEATLTAQSLPSNARAVLVLEGKLTSDLRILKNMLGVEVIEGVVPTPDFVS